jgi:hypothetical protein
VTSPSPSPQSGDPAGATAPAGPATVAAAALPPDSPPLPAEFLEAARLAPDHWISAIDPGWTGDGLPPAFAVAGRWRTGPTGEVEEWEGNEEYRPSPHALDWPEPTDALDAALQGAVTGYGPPEEVARALAEAELLVLISSDGSPVIATAADGTPVVPVFSASSHLDLVGGFAFARRTAADLLPDLPPEHRLYVNPAGPAGAVLAPDVLAEATGTAGTTGATGAADAEDGPDVADTTGATATTPDAAPRPVGDEDPRPPRPAAEQDAPPTEDAPGAPAPTSGQDSPPAGTAPDRPSAS